MKYMFYVYINVYYVYIVHFEVKMSNIIENCMLSITYTIIISSFLLSYNLQHNYKN